MFNFCFLFDNLDNDDKDDNDDDDKEDNDNKKAVVLVGGSGGTRSPIESLPSLLFSTM